MVLITLTVPRKIKLIVVKVISFANYITNNFAFCQPKYLQLFNIMAGQMEDQNTDKLPVNSQITTADIVNRSTIIEEGPRICPLCNSIVRQFFINFNDKIVMCENTECEFPFGHEELQFYKEDNEVAFDEELTSASLATGSILTTAEWMDIDKINRAYDSEDTQSEYKAYTLRNQKKNFAKVKETQQKIKMNIQKIKEINAQLCEENDDEVIGIRNEKWIRNLMEYQKTTDIKLLKDQEINKVRKAEEEIGLGEIKIDIDPKDNCVSSIVIEISKDKSGAP